MKRIVALGLTILFAVSGCATSQVWERREEATGIGPQEAVTLILTENFLVGWGTGFRRGDEQKVSRCIGRAMRTVSPEIRVVAPKEFRASLFPWFERATTPKGPAELASLLNKPLVRDRMARLRIRYVITLSGGTTEGQHKGKFGVYGGAGVAGFFGHEQWKRDSRLLATVWDLNEGRSAGTVEVSASGTASITGAIFLPIYIDAQTESTACKALGQRLARFLIGGGSEDRGRVQPSLAPSGSQ